MVFAGALPDRRRRVRGAARRAREAEAERRVVLLRARDVGALGFGFRCGFLGLLHMEIIQERLEREFNLDLITTAPGVRYRVTLTNGEVIEVDNPQKLPDPGRSRDRGAVHRATILTPHEYVGDHPAAVPGARGTQKKLQYVGGDRVIIVYEMPLNEVVLDFYDKLKTISRGYASLDYQFIGYRESDS